MQAIILSAGIGTRLKPLTNDIPKVMAPINGKSLLENHIRYLKKFNIKNIYINLFYKPEIIIKTIGDGKKFGVNIKYLNEKSLSGTGGPLHKLRKHLSGDFLVLFGDVFCEVNLNKMLEIHNYHHSIITVGVQHCTHPQDSDLVQLNKESIVKRFFFKPHKSQQLPTTSIGGLYIISKKALDYLPNRGSFDIAHDFLPNMHKLHPIYCYKTKELMEDIGTHKRYQNLIKIIESTNVSKTRI